MPLTILGIGTALPPHHLAQSDSLALAGEVACPSPAQHRVLETIYRRSGVEARHSVVLDHSDGDPARRQTFFGPVNPTTQQRMGRFEQASTPLALMAASRALAKAAIAAERITHLITVSCTGFCSPGFDLALIDNLPLSRDVARIHVGYMGCHGALNGLRVADGFLGADPEACVLLCSVELCSLHMQYGWDPDSVVANALFADGAAALVAAGRPPGEPTGPSLVASGSLVIPSSSDAMSWKVQDHGFAMTLSSRVPTLIGDHLRSWLEPWLARRGHRLDTIASWAVHPGGPRILSAVGETLDLNPAQLEPSTSVLKDCGNMSSATILFIFERLRQRQAATPWLAMAFGPGLSVEVALLE